MTVKSEPTPNTAIASTIQIVRPSRSKLRHVATSLQLDLENSLNNFGNCRRKVALGSTGPNDLLEPTYQKDPANP